MEEFYNIAFGVLGRGMATGIILVALLVVVLFKIQARDIKKYPPNEKPTRIAFAVAVYVFSLSYTFYSAGKRPMIIARDACPVAERVLTTGTGAGGLLVSDRFAIVQVCGVEFFEKHSGMTIEEAQRD